MTAEANGGDFLDRYDAWRAEQAADGQQATPAPSGPTRPPPDAYAAAALREELAALRSAARGGRNHRLNVAALKLARLPIDRDALRADLVEACQDNGLVGDDGLRSVDATINSAFGKADADGPREIPDREHPANVTEVGAADLAGDGGGQDDEPTTWEPVDLTPWLSGQHVTPKPSVGISRTDGQKMLYAGREHSVYGETESGKSWFALECCAVEIRMGRDAVYVHFEEGDPGSTIERLRLLGVRDDDIKRHLRFAAPTRPSRPGWLAELLDPPPALVVLDGVNEAMSLQGDDSMQTDGAATFRRTLIRPCLAVGAATLACDHVTKSSEGRGRYAIGSAHKVAAVDGAAFMLENVEPFGRGLRGASRVYVTKDRPGQLRAHGKPSGLPGKTFFGVLTVDASPDAGPEFLAFYPPRGGDGTGDDGGDKAGFTLSEIGDVLYDIVATAPGGAVKSRRELFARMRDAGNLFRDDAMRAAADVLVVAGRLAEVPGKRGATGYQAISTASQAGNHENP